MNAEYEEAVQHLNQEKEQAIDYFKTHTATHSDVVDFIKRIRQ